jgi:hypothetical protein
MFLNPRAKLIIINRNTNCKLILLFLEFPTGSHYLPALNLSGKTDYPVLVEKWGAATDDYSLISDGMTLLILLLIYYT